MHGINVNVHTPPEVKALLTRMGERLDGAARLAWLDGARTGLFAALLLGVLLYLLFCALRRTR